MVSAQTIQETLIKALPGAKVQVIDSTGTNDHFEAVVVWQGFEGKSLVEQHQAVMAPLQPGLKSGEIHALKIKTST
ncbi:MAG: BolA/IbaG family iron-sulfur metabolism protein [Deltaproteobacteria bacterium]|nr:BolA/IbaG family iron-sulfur metabolism protein [Deltaproteobacteria bacterium]